MIIGSNIIFRKNLSSTNSFVTALLKSKKVREGTIIQTNFQTEGRGHGGNMWESEDGMNLLISLILYPNMINPSDQFIVSKIISLGICDYLRQYTTDVSIKWPNDIYVKNDKIAGILIEACIFGDEIENIIIGIGLNVNQEIFESSVPNPVSLKLIMQENYNIETCLKNLAITLDRRYKQLLSEEREEIDKEYLGNLYKSGKWSYYSDAKGSFEGRIISVAPGGHLQIEDRQGRIYKYGLKEVSYL